MITNADYRSRAVWLLPAVLMGLILLLAAGGEPVRSALRYDASAISSGEVWRLLTGNFVHMGWWHLFLNELGLMVLVLLCPEKLSAAVWTRRTVLLGLGMSAGLYWFVRDTYWYVGMSGVIHGLFLLGLGRQLVRDGDLIAAGCIAYLVGKIAWELYAGAPVSDEQALGGKVLVESHLYGSLSALLYGLIFGAFTRDETFRRAPRGAT
ncbi:MAG TPA: rhombosortase [Verrucomicrobiae bacterium]|nr:rhombosortase [Verrucomicrobiae bacterium]